MLELQELEFEFSPEWEVSSISTDSGEISRTEERW